MVSSGTITGEVVSRVRLQQRRSVHVALEREKRAHIEVGIEETLVVAVDSTSNRRPRLLDSEDTLTLVAFDDGASRWVEQNRLDTEERKGSCSGLRLGRSRKWTAATGELLKNLHGGENARDDNGAGLGLPVRVNDGALLVSDMLPVPFPSLPFCVSNGGERRAECSAPQG